MQEEIPREQWIRFFDDFSKRHQGWIVTLEVLGQDLGDQEHASQLPLVGISADLKDREISINVLVGDRPETHLTHIINTPGRVFAKEPEEPAHEALEIESGDGTKTLLSFSHIPPEEIERQLPQPT
jgi:hypothetical protein